MKSEFWRRLGTYLFVFFFFAFPGVGLVYFWNDMHSKLRGNASTFVNESFGKSYETDTDNQMLDEGSDVFRAGYKAGTLAQWRGQFGSRLIDLSVEPVNSEAHPREDMMVQFVTFKGTAKFDKTTASVTIVVSRRTNGPRWRYDSIQLVPK